MAGWLQAVVVIGLVGALHVPLGDYMARAFTAKRHWRAEAVIYRACGIRSRTRARSPTPSRSA
jgi:K+-transporting ATPase ATPase A chain